MRLHTLHCTRVSLAVILICAISGCWQEIEYTGPDPTTTVQRRTLPQASVSEPAAPLVIEAADKPQTADVEAGKFASSGVSQQPPVRMTEPADELSPNDDLLATAEEVETVQLPETAAEPTIQVPTAEQMPRADSATEAQTRRAAWVLGSKLSLAALANDRGLAAETVPEWLAEAAAAAESLGTSFDALSERSLQTSAVGEAADVHTYLFQQGKRIWQVLSDRYGLDHAALFEMAVKTNVLLVLYAPGRPDIEPMSKSIAESGPRAQLPPELWQPLLDQMAKQSPAADVRAAVRRLHEDVDKYLLAAEKQ